MKPALLALLTASTFLSTAQAAEIEALSRIDAVTVYPQGAEVTRMAEVAMTAGDHTLIFDALPGEIDPQSIRVEGNAGASVAIGSVDSRLVHVTDDAATDLQRSRIEDQIEALRDQRAALLLQSENIGYQRQLIQDLARRPFVTGEASDRDLRVDSAELGNLFDMVATRLQALDGLAQDIRVKARGIDEDIGDLEKRLGELVPKQFSKSVVTVHLSSETETSGTFRIRYRIGNAGWRPFYDARLAINETDAPALILVRRAEIVQSTAENWNDVALTLSTARPAGATAAPQLQPQALILAAGGPERLYESEADAVSGMRDRAEFSAAHEARKSIGGYTDEEAVAMRQAEVTIAGFQALYAIAGRVSVDNSGTAKKVQISSDEIDAALSAHAAPALDPNAYLTAAFTFGGDTPLLPGRVLLFRDDVFMGQGSLPLLAPGEDYALGFGIDDNIRVKRSETRRKTSEFGLISPDRVEESSWLIEVENFHVRTMPVRIFDRMPYATHEDIRVDLLRGTTQPSERDVDQQRGILAWDYQLAAGATQAVRFGYRVSSPKDRPLQVGMR